MDKTPTTNKKLIEWVNKMVKLCQPERIVWIDGSTEQKLLLEKECVNSGELIRLNQEKLPGCFLHRTAQDDVARTEHLTFICTKKKHDAGPNNNWLSPAAAYRKAKLIFKNAMAGRTMYVIPFSMGPVGSPFSKIGVELTDSRYVVLNMLIMTRCGEAVLRQLEKDNDFTKCLHSKADLDIKKRLILHFPEDNAIWSVGSGYGGNVLLGKKCLALRISSFLARKEKWMAEHMLIMGIEEPNGHIEYIAAAFPSACGKTNLAMMIPPEGLKEKGYRVWTVGDDISWMKIGPDGRLYAINPEAGFFGVAPGTSYKSNPMAMDTLKENIIFTNCALTDDGDIWWEGIDGAPPRHAIDWKGRDWSPDVKEAAAHPNARFTAPASQCPIICKDWEKPEGVPIDIFLFGGRRAGVVPLVNEAYSFDHGVFLGATASSETTAANIGAVGNLRRDPFAMQPFCGYNMADYFQHWLDMGDKLKNKAPRIFYVNWFRKTPEGRWLWPGFGENSRVLKWMCERVEGKVDAVKTPIGLLPAIDDLDMKGLSISAQDIKDLLKVDMDAWRAEIPDIEKHFAQFGDRLPDRLKKQFEALKGRLA